jgi:hypothetical protein
MSAAAVGEIIDYGVDWLTVTCTDRERGSLMGTKALAIMNDVRAEGDELRPWSMFNFNGWQCGQIQSGEGDGSLIVRMWGTLAQRYWHDFFKWSTNCSRLDLQVTARWPIDCQLKMKQLFRNMKRNGSADGRKRFLSLYQSTDGSSTIYIGQRSSENYGRIYSKGKQTPLPFWVNSIRLEAELKGDTANHEAQRLATMNNQREYIIARVLTWFSERGCLLSLPKECFGLSHLSSSVTSPPYSSDRARYLTDSERSLTWLRSSCCLTVQKLIAAGYLNEVLDALKLHQHVSVKPRETLTGPVGP